MFSIFLLIFAIGYTKASDVDTHLDYFRAMAARGEWIGRERSSEFPPSYLSQADLDYYRKNTRLMYTSYCEGNVQNWACGVCKDQLSPIRNTTHVTEFHYNGHMGGVAAHGNVGVSHDLKAVFISFQGAVHLSEWMRCFDFFLVKATAIGVPDSIRVHQGFYNVYKSIRAQISDLLFVRFNQFPHYKITILGHSYGGALASLFALDMAQGYLKNVFDIQKVHLITIGQPRVGNENYAIAMDDAKFGNIARIIHSTDIFAHLVPRMRWIGLNYVHHKGEIWLDPSTERWTVCEQDKYKIYDESPYCSNSVPWTKRSGHAHISYTTKNQTITCPSRPEGLHVEVQYLPINLQ